ncbi:two-component sensor histidine kinase [Roseibium aquae]|uniref:histidine kinase n=1 Tax=Roseibium aquae TaxID=1323746 RepID=A0A916X279_9HYPH|nr:ATP-binding protein [Roseibium aquae]GGB50111.1 two-component sensor histidine kinase [Roseibium aquae]
MIRLPKPGLWPRSFAGQLILLLLLALFLTQAFSLWLFHDARRVALIEVARDNILMRTVSMAKLLEDTPTAMHSRILEASTSRFASFWVADEPIALQTGSSASEQRLRSIMSNRFDPPRDVRLDLEEPRRFGTDRKDTSPEAADRRKRPESRIGRRDDLSVSIPLQDGRYLNVATSYRPPPQAFVPLIVQLLLMALATILIVAFAVRRMARPLRDLARAADKLGRGEDLAPLPQRGPSEVRSVTLAFNDMQDRLTRFVKDRTRMLAAISHDLRTPITSLRIRAEFIEDEENREKIIQTLEEMSAMAEATLAFARDEAALERGEPVDLLTLLRDLTDEQEDLGTHVALNPAPSVLVPCRPVALKRALRNLIDNGARYGEAVTLTLATEGRDAVIRVQDEGPGIPEERLGEVFEPFVRLEASRSLETGGIGLGLAIARSIIHAHGGTISLSNRSEGGLTAEVRLPLA